MFDGCWKFHDIPGSSVEMSRTGPIDIEMKDYEVTYLGSRVFGVCVGANRPYVIFILGLKERSTASVSSDVWVCKRNEHNRNMPRK